MHSWTRAALEELREGGLGTNPRPPPMRYDCDLSKFPDWMRGLFRPLTADRETEEFLEGCDQVGVMAFVMTSVLRRFWSVTDTNAFVGAGQMFVISSQHVRILLGKSSEEKEKRGDEEPGQGEDQNAEKSQDDQEQQKPFETLLDIGSGDGNVTQKLAPLFRKVYCTEVSLPMVRRLTQSGFNAIHASDLSSEALAECQNMEVISLLNVLDRCDKPRTLLQQIKSRLHPEKGLLLIAVVLPFRPFVENGTEQLQPSEKLGLNPRARFESAVVELTEEVFIPAGFKVQCFSRVPYYSHSFNATPYNFCTLDDALFVLSRAD